MSPNRPEHEENKLFRDKMAFEDVKPLEGPQQYHRWRGCSGKKRLTEYEAFDILRKMLRQASTYSPETLNYYPCDECGYWHIGHFQEGKIRNGKRVHLRRPSYAKF